MLKNDLSEQFCLDIEKKVQTSYTLLCIKYINQRVVTGKAAALVLFFDDLPTLYRTVDRMCDWTGISPCLCFHFVCVCTCICVGVGNSHDLGPSAPLEYISGGLSLWWTNARHRQTRKVQAVSGPVLEKKILICSLDNGQCSAYRIFILLMKQ